MCWPFSTDKISCPMWLDNMCDPGSVSRLSPGLQRSPFSSRAIPMIPALSRVRDLSFVITVNERHLQPEKKLIFIGVLGLLSLLLFRILQRWSQMTPALLYPKLSLVGSPHPTHPMWGAVYWPINASQDMTSVALTSSPASGISPGAAAHLHVLKVIKGIIKNCAW